MIVILYGVVWIYILISFITNKRKKFDFPNEKRKKHGIWFKIVNVTLTIIVLFLLFLLLLSIPVELEFDPSQFDDDVVDLIRICALVEIPLSMILACRNFKNKLFIFFLVIANVFTIYKVMGTYIISLNGIFF